jgi:hypothetical protein
MKRNNMHMPVLTILIGPRNRKRAVVSNNSVENRMIPIFLMVLRS